MMTVEEITKELSGVCKLLQSGELEVKTGDAVSNAVGKILKANLGQLAYYQLLKDKPDTPRLPFFEAAAKKK